MFKSMFSKYLVAFISIILISFLMLSGIITSMIRSYVTDLKEEQLYKTSSSIAEFCENENTAGPSQKDEIDTNTLSSFLAFLLNMDLELDVIVTDESGNIILSSLASGSVDAEGHRRPVAVKKPAKIDMSKGFSKVENENGNEYLLHRGTLNSFLSDFSIVCAHEIAGESGEPIGYVFSLYSTARDNALIATTRRTVINSSAWVMLAAVIAIYFITDRIISPLKNMTSAAKSFGDGDFTTRVTVSGNDEVAALGNAFNNMADSLENLEKMRSSFLASVSHDLRTPMTTIAGFIDGIMSGAIPEDKQEYYLQIISSEIHRLSRLVSQILDISRLESGDRKMNFTNFDVAEVSRIVLLSFEKKIEEKNLEVSFIADDEEEMPVYADKDAIHQVIYNLCHNAIKFSREGGKLEVKIQNIDYKQVRISVYDEGQSISEEESRKIFDRFYKTDQSRGLDKTGVGLGLYISKTIIDAHGESIGVNSVQDKSCEFYFTLKRAKIQKG